MAKLILLYGRPQDPSAFEDYYTRRHLPFAQRQMPKVRSSGGIVQGSRPDEPPAYHRFVELTYDSVQDVYDATASAEGQAVLSDLDNFATGGVTALVVDDHKRTSGYTRIG